MRLRTVDLNLPVTLEALVAERGVSRAALRMGLTQSAGTTQGTALKGPLKSPAMWSLALTQGGNLFGIAAPIVTGDVVAATGGYSGAFLIAGVPLLGWRGRDHLGRADSDPALGGARRPDRRSRR